MTKSCVIIAATGVILSAATITVGFYFFAPLVETITSLEKPGNNGMAFKNEKLNAVRSGQVIVIPIGQIGTHVLSGVDMRPVKVKTKHLYKSTTGAVFPRRYKRLRKNRPAE